MNRLVFCLLAGLFLSLFPFCSASSSIEEISDLIIDPGLFNPLKDELYLTGTFGEFRNAHYHYGIDFGSRIGTPVFAARSGYLKKFMYHRYGIGYGLILQHANEFTTLYGHLDGLEKNLLAHPVFDLHREKIKNREEFFFTLPEDLLKIKRGQHIANSGDTGSGPQHLHFELRKKDEYLNPLRYGLVVPDESNLHIEFLSLLPADLDSRINGKNKELIIPVSKRKTIIIQPNKDYYIKKKPRIYGNIKIRLAAYDPERRAKLGLSSGELRYDGRLHFHFDFDRLKRLPIFSHFMFYDYNYSRLRHGARYMHNFYKSSIHPMPQANVIQNGYIDSRDIGFDKKIEVIASDASGKKSKIHIEVLRDLKKYKKNKSKKKQNVFAGQTTMLTSKDEKFHVIVQHDSLVNNVNMDILTLKPRKRLPRGIKKVSLIYSIKTGADFFVAPLLLGLVGKKDNKTGLYKLLGNKIVAMNQATYQNNEFKFKDRRPGTYQILKDFVAPVIYAPRKKTYRRNEKTRYPFRLFFKIKDIGSGVDYEKVKVLVDKKEALVEHNGDLDAVEILGPANIYKKGRHKVIVKAVDRAGNHSRTKKFFYFVR